MYVKDGHGKDGNLTVTCKDISRSLRGTRKECAALKSQCKKCMHSI